MNTLTYESGRLQAGAFNSVVDIMITDGDRKVRTSLRSDEARELSRVLMVLAEAAAGRLGK